MRPTVAEIDLSALARNYRLLGHRVSPFGGLIAVVKANAYGHGVELCGRALAEAGAGWLGVTSVEEASRLRRACAHRPRILVMSGFFPGEEAAVLRENLTPQVWEPLHLLRLDRKAREAGLRPGTMGVHLEIDTGMSRQGVAPGAALASFLSELPGDSPVWVEGILTHFSSPDQPENGVMRAQVERFAEAIRQGRAAGIHPRFLHAGNSVNAWDGWELPALQALARDAGAELLIRPGLALYGVGAPLEPVMRWVTHIVSLREVPAGTPIGYNETFRASRPMRLALLPVGYADGLRRELSGRGWALVHGRRVPIVGRVSMDQTVVDVSDIPEASLGDEAVLLGRQGEAALPAAEIAGLCGTIPYEILCGIAARVPRTAI